MKPLAYLCPDNCTFLVLLSLFNDELGTLSFLRSNLFGFNGMSELFAKAEACNGHIIQSNVEILGPLCQKIPDLPAHSLSLQKRQVIHVF
jgi:hypothetical protein